MESGFEPQTPVESGFEPPLESGFELPVQSAFEPPVESGLIISSLLLPSLELSDTKVYEP